MLYLRWTSNTRSHTHYQYHTRLYFRNVKCEGLPKWRPACPKDRTRLIASWRPRHSDLPATLPLGLGFSQDFPRKRFRSVCLGFRAVGRGAPHRYYTNTTTHGAKLERPSRRCVCVCVCVCTV